MEEPHLGYTMKLPPLMKCRLFCSIMRPWLGTGTWRWAVSDPDPPLTRQHCCYQHVPGEKVLCVSWGMEEG